MSATSSPNSISMRPTLDDDDSLTGESVAGEKEKSAKNVAKRPVVVEEGQTSETKEEVDKKKKRTNSEENEDKKKKDKDKEEKGEPSARRTRSKGEKKSIVVKVEEKEKEQEKEGEEEVNYEVEKVLAKKKKGTVLQYKVKWLGFNETSWEPAENLEGCPHKIKDFEAEQEAKKSQSSTDESRSGKKKADDDEQLTSSADSAGQSGPFSASKSRSRPFKRGKASDETNKTPPSSIGRKDGGRKRKAGEKSNVDEGESDVGSFSLVISPTPERVKKESSNEEFSAKSRKKAAKSPVSDGGETTLTTGSEIKRILGATDEEMSGEKVEKKKKKKGKKNTDTTKVTYFSVETKNGMRGFVKIKDARDMFPQLVIDFLLDNVVLK